MSDLGERVRERAQQVKRLLGEIVEETPFGEKTERSARAERVIERLIDQFADELESLTKALAEIEGRFEAYTAKDTRDGFGNCVADMAAIARDALRRTPAARGPYIPCPHCGTLTHEVHQTCVSCGQNVTEEETPEPEPENLEIRTLWITRKSRPVEEGHLTTEIVAAGVASDVDGGKSWAAACDQALVLVGADLDQKRHITLRIDPAAIGQVFAGSTVDVEVAEDIDPIDPVERHDGAEPPVCVGQWCCGCAVHPVGKPWGWNFAAWDHHFTTVCRKWADHER